MQPPTKAQFIKFAISGVIGFIVELCITISLVIYILLNPILAKLISFPIAVLTTWAINRNFAFRQHSTVSLPKELLRYFQTTTAGAITNNSIYIGILFLLGEAPELIALATAAGAISGMLVNYFGAKNYVFKKSS